ncbi:hypothetical protein INH39_29775 [Massilia violaceinigra]|uniref:Uncharacterized protein n=1 Tax=Massilia violaceinigra TaxID=2045208 RepID=A0ABY4A4F9_9BURK|nr:hypothetical protein [Massilia violaceinigra]UOD29532.1 hypothetical protein INH39_29775 [Massilia violaceinigra]
MQKLLFILLLTNNLGMLQEAQALQPRKDFYTETLNATGGKIEVCHSESPYCAQLLPGAIDYDEHSTGSWSADRLTYFLSFRVVKVCGKTIPLAKMIENPVMQKGRGNDVTYHLTISKEIVLRECGKSMVQEK